MSFNRLSYDNSEYRDQLHRDVSIYHYNMNNNKYVNSNKCRVAKGIVGGNDVSIIQGDIVNLESDLWGITRKASKIPSEKYHPRQNPPQLLHLPECDMFNYKKIVTTNKPCPKSVYQPLQF